jgi:hypothetical protein
MRYETYGGVSVQTARQSHRQTVDAEAGTRQPLLLIVLVAGKGIA